MYLNKIKMNSSSKQQQLKHDTTGHSKVKEGGFEFTSEDDTLHIFKNREKLIDEGKNETRKNSHIPLVLPLPTGPLLTNFFFLWREARGD